MMRHWWLYILTIGVALLPIGSPRIARANAPNLTIDISPQSGSPNESVTITGYGAPTHATVVVLYAPWYATIRCDDGRDAAPVTEVTSDEEGKFTATHPANQISRDHVGFTFLAKVVATGAETPQSVSNVECFRFGSETKSCFIPKQNDDGEFRKPNGGVSMFRYPISSGFAKPFHGFTVRDIEPARDNWPAGAPLQEKIQIDRWRSALGSREPLRQPIAQYDRDCVGPPALPFRRATAGTVVHLPFPGHQRRASVGLQESTLLQQRNALTFDVVGSDHHRRMANEQIVTPP